ncbi:hypothetical protein ASF30_11915 [Leifsonia sp. Leaf264]|nr:hypothetical protein ASF30_11915 [Leifsonia sp. Leaf264]
MSSPALASAQGAASTFNVRTLDWVPVSVGGRHLRVTLEHALLNAHTIDGLDTRDPLVHAALTRFLISVAVLVCREGGIEESNASRFVADGFPPAAITAALNRIDTHLHLIDDATPFLQLASLDGYDQLANPESSGALPAATLHPRTPGPASKAWLEVAGDHFNPESLTPAQTAEALVTNWFYGCAANLFTRTTEEKDGPKFRSSGSIGMFGADTIDGSKSGLTFFRTGRTLAATLLLNISPNWLTDGTLPAYTEPFRTDWGPASLGEWTFSGSAALAQYDGAAGLFTTVLRGGFPAPELGDRYKQAVTDQLRSAATNDPTRVWVDVDGQDQKLFSGISRTSSTAQHLRAWHVDAATPRLGRGLLSTHGTTIQVLEVAATNRGAVDPVLASTFTVESDLLDVDAEQLDVIRDLANSAARNPEAALFHALTAVFPATEKDGRTIRSPHLKPTLRTAVGQLHSTLEPLLSGAISDIFGGTEPTSLVADIQTAKFAAFDRAVEPFLTARTIQQIAAGRSQLGRAIIADELDPSDLTTTVAEYIRRIGTDNSYRFDVRNRVPARHRKLPTAGWERDAVLEGFSTLALHPNLQHAATLSFARALHVLTETLDQDFNSKTGIPARIAQLIQTDGQSAVQTFDSLLQRLDKAHISVNFHNVITTLRYWDHPDIDLRRSHRHGFAYRYFTRTRQALAA